MGQESHGRDMLELLDLLEAHVAEGRRVLLSNRIMVEEGEFMTILDQLRGSIPVEVKQARRVLQERQKIIVDAQSEATRIITMAKERSEYLVSQHGVTAEARYRGEDSLREAREKASRSMSQIDTYARERLEIVEKAIRDNLAEIERAKGSLAQA
jgi:vacuolar-type H+-ATPase subunit H